MNNTDINAKESAEPIFACLVWVGGRGCLEKYNDGRPWFLCGEEADICFAAYVVIEGHMRAFETLIASGHITVYRDVKNISGSLFEYIALEDACILKQWRG